MKKNEKGEAVFNRWPKHRLYVGKCRFVLANCKQFVDGFTKSFKNGVTIPPRYSSSVRHPLCGWRLSSTDITAYFLQGGCGSQHPPCLRALPHRGLLVGGQTYGLMSCVKHGDISQTPVSEHCHTLAIIVMGGSGWLNQQAEDLYYAPLYVSLIHTHTHTHIQQPTLCLSCQRSSDPRTRINGRKKSDCGSVFFFFLCVQQVVTVSSSHHSVFKSSSVPPCPQNCINILWSMWTFL